MSTHMAALITGMIADRTRAGGVAVMVVVAALSLIARPARAQSDFGDAPDSYTTLAEYDGPEHVIQPGFFLGNGVDAEADGQPNSTATGDDTAGVDDEDGVTFLDPVVAGNEVRVQVVASADGYLDGWLDFGRDGTWFEAEDLILDAVPVEAGTNTLSFEAPTDLWIFSAGASFARFRFSSTGSLGFTGLADDGEVEDYAVTLSVLRDFGDAPNSYMTSEASDGAVHFIRTGFHLGQLIDSEANGQPSTNALGDDLSGLADEDGVTFLTPLAAGNQGRIDVVASTNGYFSLWLDLGRDGNWWEPADALLHNIPVVPGTNHLTFRVPAPSEVEMVAGPSYARARFTSASDIENWGPAPDGEVEDYQVQLDVQQDYGDAPDWFGIHYYDNGPVHTIVAGVHLGNTIDGEADGKPTADASGDDATGTDDEDGVRFLTPLEPGSTASVEVIASTNGFLNAWIDFGQEGSWLELEDHILSVAVSAGTNVLQFAVPASVPIPPALTYARFRFGSEPDLGPLGPALDGEVEDYTVSLTIPLRISRFVRDTAGFVTIDWQDVGLQYTVQTSTNMIIGEWAPAEGTDWPVGGGTWTSTIPEPNTRRYYRVGGQ